MNGQISLSCGHFQLLPLQNVAKSIPDINIHLARRFQPVAWLYLSAIAPGPFEEHPWTRGRQTGHRNKPRGKQTE